MKLPSGTVGVKDFAKSFVFLLILISQCLISHCLQLISLIPSGALNRRSYLQLDSLAPDDYDVPGHGESTELD